MEDKETITEILQNQAENRKLAMGKKQIQDRVKEERLEEFDMIKGGKTTSKMG